MRTKSINEDQQIYDAQAICKASRPFVDWSFREIFPEIFKGKKDPLLSQSYKERLELNDPLLEYGWSYFIFFHYMRMIMIIFVFFALTQAVM